MDRDNFESRLSATEKDLRETKERLDTVNLDLATSKQELSCTHDQLHRTKIELQEQNLKKSEENENLRRQMQAQVWKKEFLDKCWERINVGLKEC